jgi:opacity protein-like surface antigen
MKKNFIIAGLLSLSLAATTKAQDSTATAEPAKRDFHRGELGFRFMPTFSSFEMQTSSGGVVKGEVTLGYGIGAMLGLNLTNHVGIQGEIIYNALSQKYVDQDVTREIHLNYINIPLMISLNTGKANPVNLNIVAGPQLGINVGSSMKASSDTLTTVLAIKKNDIGVAYGAGLEFILNAAKTVRLDLGYRGVYGFANISNTSQTTGTNSYYILDRAKIRTNSIYAGLTLLF